MAARGRTGRRSRKPLAPSRVDTCNPLLQAHPTWARDKHEGRGFPLLRLSPSGSISPLRTPSRADPSGLGHAATIYSSVQGPPRGRNADNVLLLGEKKLNREHPLPPVPCIPAYFPKPKSNLKPDINDSGFSLQGLARCSIHHDSHKTENHCNSEGMEQ